jgi:hypothetical protein
VTIRQPVTITAVVTQALRDEIAQELEEAITEIDRRAQQIEFAGKRAISELQVRGDVQVLMQARQQIDREKQRFVEAKQELQRRKDEIAAIADGEEIIRNTTEALVEVKVGDDIRQALRGVDLLVKDGAVIEIRDVPEEDRVAITTTPPEEATSQGDVTIARV